MKRVKDRGLLESLWSWFTAGFEAPDPAEALSGQHLTFVTRVISSSKPPALARRWMGCSSQVCHRCALSLHTQDVCRFRTIGCGRRCSAASCRPPLASTPTSYTTPWPSGLVLMPKIRCEPPVLHETQMIARCIRVEELVAVLRDVGEVTILYQARDGLVEEEVELVRLEDVVRCENLKQRVLDPEPLEGLS